MSVAFKPLANEECFPRESGYSVGGGAYESVSGLK